MNSFLQAGPILRALLRNRVGALLIAMQTAFTLAIVINAVFIIVQRIEKMNRPTGMDVEHIITLGSQGFTEGFNKEVTTNEDLRLLRELPGVIDATTTQSIPLSGSGWSGSYSNSLEDDANETSMGMYWVDDHAVQALGIELSEGRNFYESEVSYYGPGNTLIDSVVIITQAAADKLYPEGGALGKPVYSRNGSVATIVGIIGHMHGSWVGWDGLDRVMLIPKFMHSNYIVRVEAGALDGLIPVIEDQLASRNPGRLIQDVRPMTYYLTQSYRLDKAMSIMLGVVISLLVVVASLGIVSLATFNVNRRVRQIGTRRALGATRADILGYFLVENWLITGIGVVLGSMLGVAVNYWLVTSFELPRLDWYYVLGGIVFLWVLGQLSVFAPARRASGLSPALATRNL